VRRSLITLKAPIYRPSGGIVAAPTTFLPEAPSGEMNWDYRYCWLRDATFTALLNAGFHEEALAWRDWLLRAVAGAPEKMRIMYRRDGMRRLEEWVPNWLPGFRWSPPVRIGNAASQQLQLDVFGEVLDTLHLAARGGIKPSEQALKLQDAIVRCDLAPSRPRSMGAARQAAPLRLLQGLRLGCGRPIRERRDDQQADGSCKIGADAVAAQPDA
jgi:GH15 family glucan-1,4-alpha-glucosidase